MNLPKDLVIAGRLPEGWTQGKSAFITIDKVSSKETGITSTYFDDKNEIETMNTSALTTVQINAFGNNSVLMLEKLRSVLRSSYAQEAFASMKAGIVTMSDVKDIAAPFAAGYEERANLDLIISHDIVTQTPLYKIKIQNVDTHSS